MLAVRRYQHLYHFSVRLFCGFVVISLAMSHARGAETGIAKELTKKGAKLTEKDGIVTGFELADCSKWTVADFHKVAQLAQLKTLSLGLGLNDQALAELSALPNVESVVTNGMQITDEGMKSLAKFKKLHNLAFFHPGKFSGTGLAYLSDLPDLQKLTVAGSNSFGDEGMAAVVKLPHLQEFRTWHTGATPVGIAQLKEVKDLKSISLGQRLSYTPPISLSDETLTFLAGIKSLESISLMEARLSISSLTQLKQLPALKRLTLDSIDLSEAEVERLRKELPNVQIKWTKPTEANLKRINALFGPAKTDGK
jgi:hypothetical protein